MHREPASAWKGTSMDAVVQRFFARALLLLLWAPASLQQPITSVKYEERKRNHAIALADAMRNLYADCSGVVSCKPSIMECSFAQGLNLDGRSCTKYSALMEQYRSPCANTTPKCTSQKFNLQQSVVRLPAYVMTYTRPWLLEAVCRTADMDMAFRSIFDRDNDQIVMYITDYYGLFRIFPGYTRDPNISTPLDHANMRQAVMDRCSIDGFRYDSRQRPWYWAAMLGPRDVQILIDVTRNMVPVLELVKTYVRFVLSTMTEANRVEENDIFVNIILFNDTRARSITPTGGLISAADNTLMNVLNATLTNLKPEFSRIDPGGGGSSADFNSAFSEAFQTWTAIPSPHKRRKIVMLFTGSSPSAGAETDILANITTWQNQVVRNFSTPAIVLTYSMLRDSTNGLLKNISCQNNGIYTNIGQTSERDMTRYLNSYFVLGRVQNNSQAIWSTAYTPTSSTNYQVYTVTKTVLDSRGLFLGVAAVEATDKSLGANEAEQYVRQSRTEAGRIDDQNVSECTLQLLRQQNDLVTNNFDSFSSVCGKPTAECTMAQCTQNLDPSQVFADPGTYAPAQKILCCEKCVPKKKSETTKIALLVSFLGGLPLILGAIVFCLCTSGILKMRLTAADLLQADEAKEWTYKRVLCCWVRLPRRSEGRESEQLPAKPDTQAMIR